LDITNIDLELHPACQYDWLSVGTVNYEKALELNNIPIIQRVCQKQQKGLSISSLTLQQIADSTTNSFEINSAENAFIYFYTDRFYF
jgi:hypothetical protein